MERPIGVIGSIRAGTTHNKQPRWADDEPVLVHPPNQEFVGEFRNSGRMIADGRTLLKHISSSARLGTRLRKRRFATRGKSIRASPLVPMRRAGERR